ncbi:hypothetical protein LWI29_020093 [Acer saccharum]|uniref:Glycosyl hydrolase family 32 N-terminal domain-containing protein n=1 Tax=Acer saccharum TaxID=4024 RepID=A0AA39W378_ACESA|nr:hypothetical protein LWI29_020093 [Acer saccharum]
MDSQCNFSVDTLEEAEAWSLFKTTAGMCVDHPDLKSIAPKVAKKCGNMPLAIVTVANALKNQEESIWRNALNELKNPSLETFFKGEMTKEVYTSIKFSYDYLDTDELREIFLLCSRMGCTYDASIRDLFMYGLGLGFFKSSNTLEEAQCKVEALVKKLKDNSLLLDAPHDTKESHGYGIPDGDRWNTTWCCWDWHVGVCGLLSCVNYNKEWVGYIYYCPGIKHVVKASMDDDIHDYYALGTYDDKTATWVPDNPTIDVGIGIRYDYGLFYASKTFFDQNKKRRLLWGWVGESDSESADVKKGWASLQGLPRTVVLDQKTGTNLLQ